MNTENDKQKNEEIIEPEEVIEINPEEMDEPKSKNLTALIILGILYIISPIDLIPESIFGPIGLIDDAAVLAYLIKRLYDRFRK